MKKLTATGPEGLTAKRTTKRTYTHVLWVRQTKGRWEKELREAIALCDSERLYIGHGPEEKPRFEQKLAAGYDTDATWSCVTWCGRYDLAMKQASNWSFKAYHTFIGEVLA